MQRAGGAMRGPHWPAAAALVIALSGCHAIYGGHGTPAAPSPTAAVEAPAGGSGATVGTAAGGMAVAAVARPLAGGAFCGPLGGRVPRKPPPSAGPPPPPAPRPQPP